MGGKKLEHLSNQEDFFILYLEGLWKQRRKEKEEKEEEDLLHLGIFPQHQLSGM